MLSQLDKLKQKVQGKDKTEKVSINTEFYLLAKELGCLGELLGREFEVVYEGNWWNRKITKIIQKPISIPAFISMMDEMQSDYKRQNQAMKKSGKKGKR